MVYARLQQFTSDTHIFDFLYECPTSLVTVLQPISYTEMGIDENSYSSDLKPCIPPAV